ncbi:MAG: DUF2946 family protein [Xanthobacteraceae bacterium]
MAMLRWDCAMITAAACRSKDAELCRVDPACYEFVGGSFSVSGRTRGKWRQAIGWIAAYALALQTIVGGIGLIQTVSSAAAFDPFAIICSHNGTPDQIPGDAGHGSHTGHCGCCLGAPPFIEPPSPALLALAVTEAYEIIWPIADWRDRFAIRHPSQPPRGPPLPA